MLLVNNVIGECYDATRYQRRALSHLTHAVCHRISFAPEVKDVDLTGAMVAKKFQNTDKYEAGSYTGGKMPYPFIIRTSGVIDQCVPVKAITPHARKWNRQGLAVAVVGDFRNRAPTPVQWHTLQDFLACWHAYGLEITGHDSLEGGSSNSNKKCPGWMFGLGVLKEDARRTAKAIGSKESAKKLLETYGVIFDGV